MQRTVLDVVSSGLAGNQVGNDVSACTRVINFARLRALLERLLGRTPKGSDYEARVAELLNMYHDGLRLSPPSREETEKPPSDDLAALAIEGLLDLVLPAQPVSPCLTRLSTRSRETLDTLSPLPLLERAFSGRRPGTPR